MIPDIMRADFTSWKSEWVDFLEENKNDCEMICFQTLKNFDDLVPRLLESSSGILVNNGPLNEYAQQDALLYISAPDTFFDKYFTRNKIRGGRQTASHNVIRLNGHFKRFFVVKKSSTNDYIPTIKLYRTKMFSGGKIKIGCSPFSCAPWFEEELIPNSDTFGIKYNASLHSTHNKQITDLIELFDGGFVMYK